MGFFDEYKDEGGLSYISTEEKAALIKNQVPLTIDKVWFTKTGGYEGKPGFKLIVSYDDQENRGLSFGLTEGGGSRDRMLEALCDYFEDEAKVQADLDAGTPPRVTIQKAKGGYQVLVPVEAE